MRLSLVLPTLDERGTIESVVRGLLGEIDDLEEVIVVDDRSVDGTRDVARALAKEDPRVRLVARSPPSSLTASIAEGIALSSGDAVGWLDADGIVSADAVGRLFAAVRDGADLAVASRFASGGRVKGQLADGWRGRLGALPRLYASRDRPLLVASSWLLNTVLLPAITGCGVRDYTSGIAVARRHVLDALPMTGAFGEYFIDLTVGALQQGYRVVEIGYHARPRTTGASKTAPSPATFAVRGAAYLRAGWRARRR